MKILCARWYVARSLIWPGSFIHQRSEFSEGVLSMLLSRALMQVPIAIDAS